MLCNWHEMHCHLDTHVLGAGADLVQCASTSDHHYVFTVIPLWENNKLMGWLRDVIFHSKSYSQVSFCFLSVMFFEQNENLLLKVIAHSCSKKRLLILRPSVHPCTSDSAWNMDLILMKQCGRSTFSFVEPYLFWFNVRSTLVTGPYEYLHTLLELIFQFLWNLFSKLLLSK
jgi:hypothetical protein